MAFPADTKVLTTNGWKNIEDVGGRDRILTRNFIGDAQFTQPFAIKKRHYTGKVISGGQKNYQFRVTPEHEVVYTNKGGDVIRATAETVPAKRENRLKHRSRFSTDRYMTTQKIRLGNYEYKVDTLDWYKFVGFFLRRGGIDKKRTKIFFNLDKKNPKKDMDLICPVLDRLDLAWSFVEPSLVIVSQKSNIAEKTARQLGARARKSMYVPNNMIYNSTLEEGKALIEMFVRASRQDGSGVKDTVQFSTSNTKLIDSLEILGLLCGYTISSTLVRPAGYKVPAGETKRDTYVVYVRESVNEFSILRKEELDYDGKVIEIDMFEDQLLTKEGDSLPVWMKPK